MIRIALCCLILSAGFGVQPVARAPLRCDRPIPGNAAVMATRAALADSTDACRALDLALMAARDSIGAQRLDSVYVWRHDPIDLATGVAAASFYQIALFSGRRALPFVELIVDRSTWRIQFAPPERQAP